MGLVEDAGTGFSYGQLELPCVLEKIVPLLRSPSDNGHATLVIMLGKAVRDNITNEDRLATEGPYGAAAQLIRQYLDLPVPTSMDDTMAFKIMYALDRVVNHDPAIKRHAIFGVLRLRVVEMKKEHIVVERWPFTSFLRPGEPGAREEIDRKIGGGLSSLIGYLE
ncbi:hypothetical protein CCHR01_10204 [Colletotrichum chrysophilum]|uniref:Uncharacterized protein n=1 Tax=Colletotrichum chrysophilum TaxID=1836956 RepID=A0AAD9AKF9_9PEZI|nr:hypothetical protein CCHR01_10204 [Colletotrichum chrysophilum]